MLYNQPRKQVSLIHLLDVDLSEKSPQRNFKRDGKSTTLLGKFWGFQMDMSFQIGFVPCLRSNGVPVSHRQALHINASKKQWSWKKPPSSHRQPIGQLRRWIGRQFQKKPVFWKKPMVNDGKWSKESNFSEKSVTSPRFVGCAAKKFCFSLNPQAAADPTFIYWSRDPIALKDAGRHGIDMLWKRCMEIIATGLIVVLKVLLPFSVWYSFCWFKSQLIMFWMIDSFEALILVRSLRMNHRVIHQSSNPCPFMLWLCFEDSFFKEATDACMLWSAIFFAVLLVGGPRQSPPTWCQLWWGIKTSCQMAWGALLLHSLEEAGSPEAGGIRCDGWIWKVLRLGYLWMFSIISIETPSFACILRKRSLCHAYFRTHLMLQQLVHTPTYSCYTMNLKISARKCHQKPCLQLLPGSQMLESLEMALPQEACWCVEICCMNWLQCFTGAGEAKDEHLETVSKTAAASLAKKKAGASDETCSSNWERWLL